jgi:hypothetical protein
MKIRHLHAATSREYAQYELADADKAFEFLASGNCRAPRYQSSTKTARS